MGQKINPIGFRIPVNKDWRSRWFADKSEFGDLLVEDEKIRNFLKSELQHAAIARINIERFANRLRITLFTARPGLVIGRKGAEIERLKAAVSKRAGGREIFIDIKEVDTPEINAQLVAENVAQQLERRVGFRRAMKRTVQTSMDMGAQGIRVRCAGRLGGAELARTEQYKAGKVPLHTLRENIELGSAEANTLAGKIGVKVWICRPQQSEDKENATDAKTSKASQTAKR